MKTYMTLTEEYLEKCAAIIEKIKAQQQLVQKAAKWFAETILAGRMVHVFGTGHSRVMV